MGDQSQVRIKKVKAYPFPGNLEANGLKKPVEIVYIAQIGLMARLAGQFVHVGDHYTVEFELPVLNETLILRAVVVKTYDKKVVDLDAQVERIAEFQFEALTQEQKAHIVAFTRAIGQKIGQKR